MNGLANQQLEEANKQTIDFKLQINVLKEREYNLNLELQKLKSENLEWNMKTK